MSERLTVGGEKCHVKQYREDWIESVEFEWLGDYGRSEGYVEGGKCD